MDPDANLAELRILVASVLLAGERGRPVAAADAQRLAELVEALDEWVRLGGALPRDWERIYR